ncbi:Receptor-type tyrosine-protein phosphatase R [Fasciola hepatica]|uniref:protein-tyrosine-phosphatase n=1 Tax=Fasciola hepatica TaxID=6192 RepID=A0A2H1BUQ5_FASHE|nr:Receptor-type tyrosine-protein phosphatase R [Fasciola hepatica]
MLHLPSTIICSQLCTFFEQRNAEERHVTHFWYTAWPDHSSPESSPSSARQLLQLVQDAESCRGDVAATSLGSCTSWVNPREASESLFDPLSAMDTIQTQLLDPSPPDTTATNTGEVRRSASTDSSGPIVVHCSAGLGRTGCFIALCIGCEQLRREGIADVLQIVSRLRLDRGGMVQTNEQYEFIYYALATYSAMASATTPPVLRPRSDDVESSPRPDLSPNVFPTSDTG